MIEITAVGGYEEVGKNCTAINIDGTVILCDLGLHLENYIKYTVYTIHIFLCSIIIILYLFLLKKKK
jgi:mRNA degradation ribonuclease J1/J2